jgi:hypothetical protein
MGQVEPVEGTDGGAGGDAVALYSGGLRIRQHVPRLLLSPMSVVLTPQRASTTMRAAPPSGSTMGRILTAMPGATRANVGGTLSLSAAARPISWAGVNVERSSWAPVRPLLLSNFTDAHANISPFIEAVYNRKRLHSPLGYLPPEEFEDKYHTNDAQPSGHVG